jgi:hypothetical protein
MTRHLTLLLLATAPAAAFADDVLTSAALSAMGGGAVAEPSDAIALRTNPGAIALVERYEATLQADFGPAADKRWGALVVDAKTNARIGFGIGYQGGQTNPPFLDAELPPFTVTGEAPVNTKDRHEIVAGLGVNALERRLSFGLSGDVRIYDDAWQGQGVTGNLAIGVAAQPIPALTIGASVRDVLPMAAAPDRPLRADLGVRGDLPAGGDVVGLAFSAQGQIGWTDNGRPGVQQLRASIGAGGSVRGIALRAGWAWDGDDAQWADTLGRCGHSARVGLGFATGSGSFDYAIVVPVGTDGNPTAPADLRHVLSIRVHLGALIDDDDSRSTGRSDDVRWPGNR